MKGEKIVNRLAVYELGVNDIKLTIYKYSPNGFFAQESQIVEPVKLTQDMERDGYIKPVRIQETIAVLKSLDALLMEQKLITIFVTLHQLLQAQETKLHF